MTAHTTTGHFKAAPETLFNFLSKIENLPRWATSYCKGVKKEGEDYKIMTPEGEMFQQFDINPNLGTIDMISGPSKDMMWRWPTRITSDNMGGSVFSFTCIQMPDQEDENFKAQCDSLAAEFENIRQAVDA